MKKISFILISVLLLMSVAAFAFASDETEAVRDRIKDVLFDYKDAYNLRDFHAVKALYTKDALIMSFPCNSKEELFFDKFSEDLPRCSSYWVEQAFKLRLFKITSFELSGKKCTARVLWDYRDNSERGKFTPTFEFVLDGNQWKIAKEVYGRNPS
ncbi:nuclear transport factor 2 family protein [Maridesulfovibrio ferrireducens]|uniref:nuclear transport factor 2 family protein n=1 Tax=Maridesulfovibrio ferrireducens TaxID=246191 RepID=UPI001A1AF7FE|nr:nuclear transport factor 2 family protein [Maridesulfovibrio ferrireducens]MBI9110532.1 nuclear transport factor 2 family protein [Maridesulfovibrio ferrireducens]